MSQLTLNSAIVVRKQLWAICKWMGVAGSGHRRPNFANPWLKLKASYINKIYWNVNMFIYEKIFQVLLVSLYTSCFVLLQTIPCHLTQPTSTLAANWDKSIIILHPWLECHKTTLGHHSRKKQTERLYLAF